MTRQNVLLFGATGTIGRATAQALIDAGHTVTCAIRRPDAKGLPEPASRIETDVTDATSVAQAIGTKGTFDAVMSCLASRTGAPKDAWAIDHDAHQTILAAAQRAGVAQFVLLSAVCVQKPQLAFQHAKLAFEASLIKSGLTYSIVRPTAYFKSLSGQLNRIQSGKPFLLFGDGALTACKPISDADLGAYLTACLTDHSLHNAVLPIGGPGPALTPREQGEALFAAAGITPNFRQVPIGMMDAIIAVLGTLGRISSRLAAKADLARIGRYYATESMLVWDADKQAYCADQTPETGTDTLPAFYARLAAGEENVDLGDHSVF